jgi:protein-S-isoprenylcysteine O-methyltransferase Ste14
MIYKINSKLLVPIQFISIFLILLPKQSTVFVKFWWLLPLIAVFTALWIFTHNKVGNFNIVPEIRENASLVVTGPYKYVRHPMYSSLILFMVGIVLWKFCILNVVFLSMMIMAVFIKAYKEEKLWLRSDEAYKSYKISTKMVVPFLF